MKKFRYIVLNNAEDLTFGTNDVDAAMDALKSHQFDCFIDTQTGIRVEYYDAEPEEIPEFVDIPIEEFLG